MSLQDLMWERKRASLKEQQIVTTMLLKPYGKTAMDALKEAGFDVISIGKIVIYLMERELRRQFRSKSSVQGMEQTIECLDQDFTRTLLY